MSEMPERIWAWPDREWDSSPQDDSERPFYSNATQYVRADILAAKDGRIAELEAVLREWLTAWAGYAEYGDFRITTDASGVCNDIEKNETATRTRAILGDAE